MTGDECDIVVHEWSVFLLGFEETDAWLVMAWRRRIFVVLVRSCRKNGVWPYTYFNQVRCNSESNEGIYCNASFLFSLLVFIHQQHCTRQHFGSRIWVSAFDKRNQNKILLVTNMHGYELNIIFFNASFCMQ